MTPRIESGLSGRLVLCLAALFVLVSKTGAAPAAPASSPRPQFSEAIAFDTSVPLQTLAPAASRREVAAPSSGTVVEVRRERGPDVKDRGHSGDGALHEAGGARLQSAAAIAPPLLTFEGLSNQDNFNLFGFRVNPPDPVGDVGPNHYVEMINLAFAVYDKLGNLLVGPMAIGALWEGFAVPDCTDPSGDPIVVYDPLEDRWLLSQFTTRFTSDPQNDVFYNCIAISQTGDPTGAYYRYAFTAGNFFPDYPKYGVWKKSYVLTSRDFGPTVEYGISVYALEKNKMIAGSAKARAVKFFLDSDVVPLNLIGDGLLPADIDGTRQPKEDAAIPIIGTQDDSGPYGATSDALNVWDLLIKWKSSPEASLVFRGSLPVAPFDSIFPCAPTARDCLPQPGITAPAQFLDILSYRQRPTWRLAYRNSGSYEALVTNQSVEARPGVAGVRWYEIRRTDGQYLRPPAGHVRA